MRTLWNDLRYGLRILAANPGFAAVAVLSLAIGIGANTAMFSLADALLLRPLPVERSSEIVRVVSTSKSEQYGRVSYPDYQDFRDQSKTLSGLLATRNILVGFAPNPNSPSQLLLGTAVSANFFDVLNVRPSLGRGFRADEDRQPVVVISDFVWESQFGRDPSVIGRAVKLSKVDFTIIGVAPKSFSGLDPFVHEAMFVPLGVTPRFAPDEKDLLDHRERTNMAVYGRLAPGHTAIEAQAELQTVARNLERAYLDSNRGRSALVMPELTARMRISPDDAAETALLLAIAGLVLLIACANVASLLLSRARARSKEIAIRLAIGAGRARLLRQLLTESLLLALVGGVAGLGLALAGIRFFASLRLSTTLPLWLVTRVDLRVLFVCGAAAVFSGVIFGIVPALNTLRADLTGALKAGDSALSGKRRRFQVRNILVVGQVAVCMVLLLMSGLLVKDFANVTAAKAGFRTDHILLLTLDPSLVGYNERQGQAFYRQLVERVAALPGVRSAALGEHIPLGVTSSSRDISIPGYEIARGQQNLSVLVDSIDEHYLGLMQIPVLRGRNFATTDTSSSTQVAIVNQAMAEKYWPKRDPLGARIQMGKQTLEVVGIARNIKYRDLTEHGNVPFLYLPLSQQYMSLMTLHVDTAMDPTAFVGPVTSEIRRLDAGVPVQDVQTLQHFFREVALFGTRLITQVVTAIGLLGLLLATTGLYGVIAYSVSRRTREIGIRVAVGANPASVARMVLSQGLKLTAIGGAIGLALSLLASSVLSSLLVDVSARDLSVYVSVPLLLTAITLLACYVPARRAARIDPLQALRQE